MQIDTRLTNLAKLEDASKGMEKRCDRLLRAREDASLLAKAHDNMQKKLISPMTECGFSSS